MYISIPLMICIVVEGSMNLQSKIGVSVGTAHTAYINILHANITGGTP